MSLISKIMLYYVGVIFFALAFLTFIVERVWYRHSPRRRAPILDRDVVERQRQEAIARKQREQAELSRVAEAVRQADERERQQWVEEDRAARLGFSGSDMGHTLQSSSHSPAPQATQRRRPTEREVLLDEQDREFQESLARDREKERQIKEKEMRRKNLEKLHAKVLDSLAPEPPSSFGDTCHLAIRVPDGSRLQRVFRNDTQLQEVHSFVLAHLLAHELAKQSPQEPPPFQLLISPPRTVFSDLSMTLRGVGLAGKGVIFAESL